MRKRDRLWRAASGVCLVLAALPCLSLEIGQISVVSSRGEPLIAHARIHLKSSESIDNSCLSVGDQSDFPESDHGLIGEALLSLSPTRDTIHITTSRPLNQTAASIALRVRCGNGPLTVRALSLYPNSPKQVRTTPEAFALPGSSLTVRSGDSIYGIARTIYPNDDAAVRNLAHAIVLANPSLFPAGPRPLHIGERLAIPDLRMVKRIIDGPRTFSRAMDLLTSGQSKPVAKSDGPTNSSTSNRTKRIENLQATQLDAPHSAGKLQLKLSRGINANRGTGVAETDRTAPRPGLELASSLASPSTQLPLNEQWAARIAQIREIQNDMNLRLARLELTVAFLQTAAAVKQNQGTTPLSLGAQPAPPVTNDSFDQQTKSNWLPKAQWRQWQIAGVIVILLIGVVLVFGKRLHNRPRILTYRQRIDNILEEAREAAAPLLGTDPALPAGDNFSQPPLYATNIHDDSTIREQAFRSANSANYATDPDAGSWPAESSELESNPNLTTIRLPTAKLTDVDGPLDEVTKVEDREIPPSQYLAVAKSNEAIRVSAEIRQEMTEAIDSSRSMFSDIDRFIALGRSQNALSLLEFQIKRDPSDRQAWVKMLAIYHQEAMDEEFERTYAAFVEKFGS